MELLSIIFSGLLTLVSPVNFAFDNIAEGDIREALYAADRLEVRLDNSPNYFLLTGKIERLRFAGRGLYVTPEFRIDTLEVETDPIAVDLERLQQEDTTSVPQFLKAPLQAGVRLILTEEDINTALRSALVVEQLGELGIGVVEEQTDETDPQRFQLVNPNIEFLDNDRLRFQVEIQDRRDNESATISIETGLEVVAGSQIQAVEPTILINDEEAPSRLANIFVKVVNRILNLEKYEDRGLLARLLKFEITPEQLEVAAFIRIEQPQQFSQAQSSANFSGKFLNSPVVSP